MQQPVEKLADELVAKLIENVVITRLDILYGYIFVRP